jgi:hypothetical protein
MAEVILHCAQIGALVGQVVAAAMSQGVRMDVLEAGALGRLSDDVVDRLARQLRATL